MSDRISKYKFLLTVLITAAMMGAIHVHYFNEWQHRQAQSVEGGGSGSIFKG